MEGNKLNAKEENAMSSFEWLKREIKMRNGKKKLISKWRKKMMRDKKKEVNISASL